MMQIPAWVVSIISVLLNVVFLMPRKWKLWIWGKTPFSRWFSGGEIVEQQLTPAQKRQQTLLLKKQKDAVKEEALNMLKYIHDAVGDDDRTINYDSLVLFIRKMFHKSSKQMREFLGVPEKMEALSLPPTTDSTRQPLVRLSPRHQPLKEELDTEIKVPSLGCGAVPQTQKRPIKHLPPKQPTLQDQLFEAIRKRPKII
jgi:hypothetical protein